MNKLHSFLFLFAVLLGMLAPTFGSANSIFDQTDSGEVLNDRDNGWVGDEKIAVEKRYYSESNYVQTNNAKLWIMNLANNNSQIIEIKQNMPVSFGDLTITLRGGWGSLQKKGVADTQAYIMVADTLEKREVFSGWISSKYPTANQVVYQQLLIRLL